MSKNNFIFILGMHRSGTSCLAGAMERCGVYLGDVRRSGQFNKKGYFEIRAIQELNDKILNLNQGAWNNPPKSVEINDECQIAFKELIKSLETKSISGIKDPRNLLMLPQMKNLINANCLMVGTFRHPFAVAKSLEKRNGLKVEKGLELWLHYNNLLISEHQKSPFPIIEYNLLNSSRYYKNILSIAKIFNLHPQKLRLKLFISRKLENYNFINENIPQSLRESYSYLKEHSIS